MSKNVNNEVRMNPPIYKHGQEVELRATENNIGSQSEQDLNPEPMDFKSGVLTTRPCCEWTVWQFKDMIDHPSYISQVKQLWNESLEKNIPAWTGFEPMTSATPVRWSTNWAIKPPRSNDQSYFHYNYYLSSQFKYIRSHEFDNNIIVIAQKKQIGISF